MNSVTLFTCSLLAANYLAASSASNSSLKHDSSGNVDPLQTLIMKRHPEMLPPFLTSLKGLDMEMAYAFSIGLALGGTAKNMVIQKRVCVDRILLEVSPTKFDLFLTELGKERWKDLGSKTIGESVLPLLFKMELLSSDLGKSNAPMTLMDFRSLIAKQSMHPAAMLIADVAILMWLANEIRVKPDEQLVEVDQSVLEALCALSMYPDYEKHCTNDLFKVLTQVQKLILLDTTDKYLYSLVNIIKQLDDQSPIRKVVEEIASCRLSKVYNLANKKFVLVSRILLGAEHAFVKSIEKVVPSAELTTIKDLHDLIASKIEMHALCNVWNLTLMPNVFCFSLKQHGTSFFERRGYA